MPDLQDANAKPDFLAPVLDYRPRLPKTYRPRIGLIGCGGISRNHLAAYKQDRLDVVALCDLDENAARTRQKDFYPDARIFKDYRDLLKVPEIDVVDISLHPQPRAAAIEAALKAGKHVLSQKPFALDLDVAERLIALARRKRRYLAVNQNGRWAPYVRYMTLAIQKGLIGDLHSVSMHLNWNHTWIKGKAFERIHHVVLYDFAVHWFDMCSIFLAGQKPLRVFGSAARTAGQALKAPLTACASIQFENGLANLLFDACSTSEPCEVIRITGTKGTLESKGPVCRSNSVRITTADGSADCALEGAWIPDGFRGTMGELLCAIEEEREPFNSGRDNLRTLAITFAALGAADRGKVQVPGAVRRLGKTCRIDEHYL